MTLESNSIGKSSVENPRKRWVNAVEMGNRNILKARNWRRKPLDKQVWRRRLRKFRARFRAVAPKNKEKQKQKKKEKKII
jgi:hypothetical protein